MYNYWLLFWVLYVGTACRAPAVVGSLSIAEVTVNLWLFEGAFRFWGDALAFCTDTLGFCGGALPVFSDAIGFCSDSIAFFSEYLSYYNES